MIFNNTIFSARYFRLIQWYQNNPSPTGERHHIIPKSLGGSSGKSNLILVPARVHFILHRLLPNAVVSTNHKDKMRYALWRMVRPQEIRGLTLPYKVTSRQYEIVRAWVSNDMRTKNAIRWAGNNTYIDVTCEYCGVIFTAKRRLKARFCSCKCRAKNQNAVRKQMGIEAFTVRADNRGRTPWNKGKPNPTAASNGKEGATASSIRATGRRMIVDSDGIRRWIYPESNNSEHLVNQAE